jgi:predicted secreted hydrolase
MVVTDGIQLPLDQYGHEGAPSEWWWHIGTLRSGDRVFGFEINATGRPDGNYGFAEVMVSDVAGGQHYQSTAGASPLPPGWCQTDPTQRWSVNMNGTIGGTASISMLGAEDNCLDMQVNAQFTDEATGKPVSLDVRFVQNGQPLLVWGTGVKEVNPDGNTPLERNNYYYSFTQLAATGTITIDGEVIEVDGTTWMDHEYGYFGTAGAGPNWVLQDAQLSNNVSLSSYAVGVVPQRNVPYASQVTILWPDGNSIFVNSVTTPRGEPYPSKGSPGVDYYLQMDIDIADPPASLSVVSVLADQEFPIPNNSIYEGAATVTGTFAGEAVTGTGWLEEKVKAPGPKEAGLEAAGR